MPRVMSNARAPSTWLDSQRSPHSKSGISYYTHGAEGLLRPIRQSLQGQILLPKMKGPDRGDWPVMTRQKNKNSFPLFTERSLQDRQSKQQLRRVCDPPMRHRASAYLIAISHRGNFRGCEPTWNRKRVNQCRSSWIFLFPAIPSTRTADHGRIGRGDIILWPTLVSNTKRITVRTSPLKMHYGHTTAEQSLRYRGHAILSWPIHPVNHSAAGDDHQLIELRIGLGYTKGVPPFVITHKSFYTLSSLCSRI